MTPIKSVCNDVSCRDVAIINSKSYNLLHILSIRNEDGRELTSTKPQLMGTQFMVNNTRSAKRDANSYGFPDCEVCP